MEMEWPKKCACCFNLEMTSRWAALSSTASLIAAFFSCEIVYGTCTIFNVLANNCVISICVLFHDVDSIHDSQIISQLRLQNYYSLLY